MAAITATVHQQLATKPATVMRGIVVSDGLAGKSLHEFIIGDFGSHVRDQPVPLDSFIPFSRRKSRRVTSSSVSTLR